MANRTINLTDDVIDYVHRYGVREHPVLAKLRERTAPMEMATMQIGPDQGAFMALLVKLIGAKRILEIGTFTGYSSTAMALALPADGRIICLRRQPRVDRYRPPGLGRCRRRGQGRAAAGARRPRPSPTLDDDSFDLAFIDADKPGYDAYYEGCLRVVRPGGLILIDNILWSGKVADPAEDDENTRIIAPSTRRSLPTSASTTSFCRWPTA